MDLEHKAIERLKMASELSRKYYDAPLLLAYSGGKDSEVCLELCRRAGVPFKVFHAHTTADAPETVYHVRKVFHELETSGIKCTVKYPMYKGKRISMWELIPPKLLPPTRVARYCCTCLKEGHGKNRCTVLGIRTSESIGRRDSEVAEHPGKTRDKKITFDMDNGDERIIAPCQMKAKIKIHPIVDWADRDVWSFLRDAKVEMNPCYSMGFNRVGCVGCPMAGKVRWREFRQWPAYVRMYKRAFEKMLEQLRARGKPCIWRTGEDVFRWWMDDKNLDGQMDLFGNEIGGMGREKI